MGFDYTTYFLYPYRSASLDFSRLFKTAYEFCGFTKVPDASKITRFKQDFLDDLQFVFDKLVDVTEPICHGGQQQPDTYPQVRSVFPPLIITKEHIDEMIEKLEKSLA